MDKEELEQIHGDDKLMKEIRDKAIELNNDPKMYKLMSDEKEDSMFINTLKDSYYEDGLEKGKNEEKINIAKELLNKKYSLKEIEEITGLTKEEIDKLK